MTPKLLSAALAAIVALLGLAPPAQAASEIIVDSPVDGARLTAGSELLVTGTNQSADPKHLSLECEYSSDWAEVMPGEFSHSFGPLPDIAQTCLLADGDGNALGSFQVVEPGAIVSAPAVSWTAFYPLVADGYRDRVAFRWSQSTEKQVALKVVNSAGVVVRTASTYAWQGRNEWVWAGRNNAGNKVAAGNYRIHVSVDGSRTSAQVSVRTAVVTKSFRKRKEGNQASSFSTGGDCFARRDSYAGVADLDCWGGRYARARYSIAIPTNAFDLRAVVSLLRSDSDICCQGRITKGWSRPSRGRVAFYAQVSGWRATTVNAVVVTYKAKTRI